MKRILIAIALIISVSAQAQTTADSIKAAVNLLFTAMKNADEELPIKNKAGEEISGSTTGPEIRLGIKISFGATPPEED